MAAARTDFEPYQFKPVVKFLTSPYQRILIADEVGLGKTIEAIYIYAELKARSISGDLRRVLIVVPAKLREKWKRELESRLGESFTIIDNAGFRNLLNPRFFQRTPEKLICSVESIHRSDIVQALRAYPKTPCHSERSEESRR